MQLKLAARRYQDFADVVSLIRENGLDEAFAARLHPSVRTDYLLCLDEKHREDEYERGRTRCRTSRSDGQLDGDSYRCARHRRRGCSACARAAAVVDPVRSVRPELDVARRGHPLQRLRSGCARTVPRHAGQAGQPCSPRRETKARAAGIAGGVPFLRQTTRQYLSDPEGSPLCLLFLLRTTFRQRTATDTRGRSPADTAGGG